MLIFENFLNSGRVLAAIFERLPSKRTYPDYYQIITLPVSLSTIGVSLFILISHFVQISTCRFFYVVVVSWRQRLQSDSTSRSMNLERIVNRCFWTPKPTTWKSLSYTKIRWYCRYSTTILRLIGEGVILKDPNIIRCMTYEYRCFFIGIG